jgi:hypothetical protein
MEIQLDASFPSALFSTIPLYVDNVLHYSNDKIQVFSPTIFQRIFLPSRFIKASLAQINVVILHP